ncbi:hypothetical protein CR513_13390, partial [Mucuna pruriens]
MGWSALNKLRAMVSTYHLCMKYPIGQDVGRASEPNLHVLDLDLDPRCDDERKRPLLTKDLKEVNISPNPTHKTKIGTALVQEEESHLVSFLRENWDVFAWSPTDMPRIDPEFICHHLSISPGFRPVAQQWWKLGDEKRKVARKETRSYSRPVSSRGYSIPHGWKMW